MNSSNIVAAPPFGESTGTAQDEPSRAHVVALLGDRCSTTSRGDDVHDAVRPPLLFLLPEGAHRSLRERHPIRFSDARARPRADGGRTRGPVAAQADAGAGGPGPR